VHTLPVDVHPTRPAAADRPLHSGVADLVLICLTLSLVGAALGSCRRSLRISIGDLSAKLSSAVLLRVVLHKARLAVVLARGTPAGGAAVAGEVAAHRVAGRVATLQSRGKLMMFLCIVFFVRWGPSRHSSEGSPWELGVPERRELGQGA
jgi:hypothetical protein